MSKRICRKTFHISTSSLTKFYISFSQKIRMMEQQFRHGHCSIYYHVLEYILPLYKQLCNGLTYMMGWGLNRFFLKISPHHLHTPAHLLINFCVDTNVDMGHQKTMSSVSTQFSLLIFKVYPVLTKV
jgi:hypothetical protein